MFKSIELNSKANNLERFHKLCLREFPEFSYAISELLKHKDFQDMLREYSYCETILLNLEDLNEKKKSYNELKTEIRQEMKEFILNHLRNKSV